MAATKLLPSSAFEYKTQRANLILRNSLRSATPHIHNYGMHLLVGIILLGVPDVIAALVERMLPSVAPRDVTSKSRL